MKSFTVPALGSLIAVMSAWLATIALSGCGFQLQGVAQMPEGVERIHLATEDYLTPFAVEMREAIERSGAVMSTTAEAADVVLRIDRDRMGRQVLSVSATNTPQEYEIFYWVDYAIYRDGEPVVPVQRLEMWRTISFSNDELLAKSREQDILHEAMARDIADLVLRKLEAL